GVASCMTSYKYRDSAPGALVAVARGAAAPLAAVGQVGAYRRPRSVGILGGDGAKDTLVLGVHLAQVGAPFGVGHGGPFACARDDGLAQHGDDLREMRVARGACDTE